MSNLKEEILSMWKSFNDTVTFIMKADSFEANIDKLAKIIHGNSNTLFICSQEPNITFEQYCDIQKQYKAFTVWLLGQFFYLLGHEKFTKAHDTIVETQIFILNKLSNTLLHIYHEISEEYKKVLKLLVQYLKEPQGNLTLEVFSPKTFDDFNGELNLNQIYLTINSKNTCTYILPKLLKFIKYILVENFTFCSIDNNTCEVLDELIYLFSESEYIIKLEIIDIFIELSNINSDYTYSPDIKQKLLLLSSLFEQFIYHVYESEDFDIDQKKVIENFLIQYINIQESGKKFYKNIYQINSFLFNKCIINEADFQFKNDLKLKVAKEMAKTFDIRFINEEPKLISFSNDALIFALRHYLYKDINSIEIPRENLKIYSENTSKLWNLIYSQTILNMKELDCSVECKFTNFFNYFKNLFTALVQININIMKNKSCSIKYIYFNERDLLSLFLNKYLNHVKFCDEQGNSLENALNFLLIFAILTNSKNIYIIFQILGYPLLKSHCFKYDGQYNTNFITDEPLGDIRSNISSFYKFLGSYHVNNNLSLQLINQLFIIISCRMVSINNNQLREIENLYLKICKGIKETQDENMTLVIKSIPNILTIFENTEYFLTEIYNPSFLLKNNNIIKNALNVLPAIICCTNSEYTLNIQLRNKDTFLNHEMCCKSCIENLQSCYEFIKEEFENETASIEYSKTEIDQGIIYSNLKHVLFHLSSSSNELKKSALEVLPSLSIHVLQFHSINVAKVWTELGCDPDKEVRMKFAKVVGPTVKYCQENKLLSENIKQEILTEFFTSLLKHTKTSLKYSNFELQDTILSTFDAICSIKGDYIILESVKILLYLIMIPTSKYTLIAVNRCLKLAEKNETNTKSIYRQNRSELCEVIAHLCCINQALINYSLSTSLEKVSLMLGFYGSKDFINQDCNYILPYFVSKIVTMPSVSKLIEEAAIMMDMEVSDMLASKYGYIFIHVFLEDKPKDDIKKCLMYLEKTADISGITLRKRNFRIILNELLLNFHEKNKNVILALKLLSNEDPDYTGNCIQDYLHSHFLGVLLYFDGKLISVNSRKDQFLLSLAKLLKFMGPKHIMPLRFKIIAMLQTINYENFPILTSEVWDAFIRSCEIECLGPQLAAISVSILPLLDHCPNEINKIFHYLLIENETHMKQYIADLFFVTHNKLNHKILLVIQKYLKNLESCSLKEKLQKFLKYLTYEAMEVRIQGLKKLKAFLEENREELDQMILDYNGMDPTIVELIEVLTLGCREEDENLKLACGDVFGELGAIEPSHMPRKYNQDVKSFSFYINDDSFIVSSLSELIKAFQSEKNTQSMDRYALAIQETLKRYEISPDTSSQKYYLWQQFPDTQKEVMLPLLSSRYMIAQPVLSTDLPTPIYGSNIGVSFDSWLFNWTSSLISALPTERKESLKVYLPSMKQDKRILMHFLPHILVHALLENKDGVANKTVIEIQTVTNSFNKKRTIDQNILDLKPIRISGLTSEVQTITPEEVKQIQCTKVVFLLLDFLDRWVREWQWQKGVAGMSDSNFQLIKAFQNKFCKLQLAKCNYHSGEYPRALMYLEDYIMDNQDQLANNLSFFAEICTQLGEPDGVDGAMALQQNEPSIDQKILALEVSGKLADAINCYERMPQPLELRHIQGLTQCYLALDNVNTALHFVRGALDSQPLFDNMLLEMQAEPLWRLGQYDELNTLLEKPDLRNNKSWGVQVGKALLHMKNGERDQFKMTLEGLQKQQVLAFSATSLEEGAYKSGYEYISKLHALNELQQVEKVVSDLLISPNNREYAETMMKKLLNEWSLRIKVVQESVVIVEPLLCLRRVSLNLAKTIAEQKIPNAVSYLNSLIGECWLLSAKTARSAGMHQQAYTYTLKAEEYAPSTLFLEKAKLHWLRVEHEQAFHSLKRGLEVLLPDGTSPQNLTIEQRKICAEAKLLIASYNDEISNVEIDVNKQNYKESVDMFKEWEKSLVYLAQYLDKICQNLNESKDLERESKSSDLQLQMINYFGKSLQFGTSYIYQSMPRLLSIWFDYGTKVLDITESSKKEERKTTLLRMTKLIDSFLERLPTFVFLTAISQLVSRICHPQKEVHIMLKSIIIKLLQHYPQQSLWMIISVIKSSYSVRSRRCAEILCDPRLKTTSLTKLVKDFTSFAEKLIELCNKEIPSDVQTASVTSLLRTLPRLLSKEDFSQIMMPTFKLRKLILPNPDFSNAQHNPFPNAYVYIVGIEDELNVLNSLQRPRKISLRGSDGKKYIFMLKPKDDLRKDFRLMEFNDIVNQLLTREGEARQRRLNIRLYSVAPLNEECGLIEWVPNLIGLRNILISIYKQKGCFMKPKDFREISCNLKDSLEKKRDVFLKKLIPRHPPVLGEWFRKTFPDAQTWLTARTAYVRTTAVMSMAGYILGLGDRHGENINLDSTCGDVVHVDFNCLFNKGEKFEWPERVPFRLTHNMVSAMGPLGVEGIFRKSCACTLRVLRNNTNTLMSIVAPFVYDPLVSWPRYQSSLPSVHNAERTNEEAVDHIKNIEFRLQGIVKTRNRTLTTPLSVEGQTNYLIKEAVSIENLCQMYIGWGAYM